MSSLLEREDIWYLSEMMNYPGVINSFENVIGKIAVAKKIGKVIDGHAPGVRSEDLKKYISAGISTDHECFTAEEALEKLENGMKVIIREGSAAKNFNALINLLDKFPEMIMFCSDDKHPDELIKGHINQLVVRALQHGCELMNVLRAACLNPVKHYGLPVGLLQVDDFADFIIVDNLSEFNVRETYVTGRKSG